MARRKSHSRRRRRKHKGGMAPLAISAAKAAAPFIAKKAIPWLISKLKKRKR